MDPHANLEEQLNLASRLIYEQENERPSKPQDIIRLAELILALDTWIKRGGALPSEWQRHEEGGC
jgi:hypothetical protein